MSEHKYIHLDPPEKPNMDEVLINKQRTVPAVPIAQSRIDALVKSMDADRVRNLWLLPFLWEKTAAAVGYTTDGAKNVKRAVVDNNFGGSLTIYIDDIYGITPQNGSRLLSEDFTIAQAVAEYPNMFTAFRRDGWSDTKIMGLTRFHAAHEDALWWNADWVPLADAPGLCLSRNTIYWPHGPYQITSQMNLGSAGRYEGSGGTGGSDWPSKKGNTHIIMDGSRWIGSQSTPKGLANYCAGTESNFGYSEGFILKYVRVTGFADEFKKPGRQIIGIELWDLGEGSEVGPMFTSGCDIGTSFVRGTPGVSSGVLSSFSNTEAGFGFVGCVGATYDLNLSADDNPAVCKVMPGYGRVAGLGANIGMVKSEWAVTPARDWKPQCLLVGEGWIVVNFGFVSHAVGGNQFQDALIDIKPNVNTSMITIAGLRVFAGTNLRALLHDAVNSKTWLMDNGFLSKRQRIEYYSDRGGMLFAFPESYAEIPGQPGMYGLKQLPYVDAPHQERLGHIQGGPDGQPLTQFDRIAGTPSWSDYTGNGGTTPPPPVCHWVLGDPNPWGECVNGKQTRTIPYKSSVDGCTPADPKPDDLVQTQDCGTTPPPTGGDPYKDHTIRAGSVINLVDFDNGGNNVGYRDTTTGNAGGKYRTDQSVDIETCSEGGFNIGWIDNGEWWNYTIKTVSPGQYTAVLRVAGETTNRERKVRLEMDGALLATFTIPKSTQGWQSWVDVTIPGVNIPNGKVLKLVAEGYGFNLKSLRFA